MQRGAGEAVVNPVRTAQHLELTPGRRDPSPIGDGHLPDERILRGAIVLVLSVELFSGGALTDNGRLSDKRITLAGRFDRFPRIRLDAIGCSRHVGKHHAEQWVDHGSPAAAEAAGTLSSSPNAAGTEVGSISPHVRTNAIAPRKRVRGVSFFIAFSFALPCSPAPDGDVVRTQPFRCLSVTSVL